MNDSKPLILASGSPYRRELLERFGIPFTVQAADIDERILPEESSEAAVMRLAREKAAAVAAANAGAAVIGSDQVAVFEGRILGKPGDSARARHQLLSYSGGTVRFLAAVCVQCDGRVEEALEPVSVRFRALDAASVDRYIAADRPFDCAGAIRSEGLGATLLEAVDSQDPTALIGLPLISLSRLLRAHGFILP